MPVWYLSNTSTKLCYSNLILFVLYYGHILIDVIKALAFTYLYIPLPPIPTYVLDASLIILSR
jgi:hypothetical protein